MHEVAVPSTQAMVFIELPAASLAEVADWRVLWGDGSTLIKAPGHSLQALFCILLIRVLHVYVAEHVIPKIFHDVQVFDLPKLGELLYHFFVKVLEVFLIIRGWLALDGGDRGDVQVRDEQSLAEVGAEVVAGAAIAMAASPDFEVEGAVYFVFLRSDNSGQTVGHAVW